MNRRALLASLAAGSVFGARAAFGRPRAEMHRLGVLFALRMQGEGLLEALADVGHIEGRNLQVEWRYLNGDFSLVPRMAAELVRLEVDVLLTAGTPLTRALRLASGTIPIVTNVAEPIAGAFTHTLARPSENVTGLTLNHPDTPTKQVELFRAVMPRLDRLAIVGKRAMPIPGKSLDTSKRRPRPRGSRPRSESWIPRRSTALFPK